MKVLTPNLKVPPTYMEVIFPAKDKLCISTQEGYHVIPKCEISFLRAHGNYTEIVASGTEVLCAQTLCLLLRRINTPNLIRIHRSHAINLDFVKHIDAAHSTITMIDGSQHAVSRSRKQKIKHIIQQRFD